MKKEKLIIDILKQYPSKVASVIQLSKDLQVSENTIKRHILVLEKHGKIIRYHGGVILKDDEITHKNSLSKREKLNTDYKKLIAQEAIKHVGENNIIFVDLGSTCKRVFEILIKQPYLTIITPYLDMTYIAHSIHKTTKIIIPAGIYDPMTRGVYGIFTEDFFDNMQVHIAFIGVNGISNKGVSINNVHETEYKRTVIKVSKKQ